MGELIPLWGGRGSLILLLNQRSLASWEISFFSAKGISLCVQWRCWSIWSPRSLPTQIFHSFMLRKSYLLKLEITMVPIREDWLGIWSYEGIWSHVWALLVAFISLLLHFFLICPPEKKEMTWVSCIFHQFYYLFHISDERFEMSRERTVKWNAIWRFVSGFIFHIVFPPY